MSKERSIFLSKTLLAAVVALALAVGATQATASTRSVNSCMISFPSLGACANNTECQAMCDAAGGPGYVGLCGNQTEPGCCRCLGQ